MHAADFGICVVEEDIDGFAEYLVRACAPLGCSTSSGGAAGSWAGSCDCHCAGWMNRGLDEWADG